MNQPSSIKIWGMVPEIHSKICSKRSYLTFLADPIIVLIECIERFHMNQQHYFEDVLIDFEKVIICENK